MKIFYLGIVVLYFSCKSPVSLGDANQMKYSKIDSLVFKQTISKYGFVDGDTIVDIGAGYGLGSIELFRFNSNSFYILEDINKKFKNYRSVFVLNNGVKKYFKQSSRRIYGTDESIPLKSNSCKNVFCRISLHEFTKPNKMLSEINRIMTKDGMLVILEKTAKFEGEIEKGCNVKLLSKDFMLSLMKQNHFILTSSDSAFDKDKKFDNGYIMKFKKLN